MEGRCLGPMETIEALLGLKFSATGSIGSFRVIVRLVS